MSVLARTLRRRSRDRKRAASGFDIESIRVGSEELLAGVVPAEMFEVYYGDHVPPKISATLMPDSPLRLFARRREGGFPRRFVAAVQVLLQPITGEAHCLTLPNASDHVWRLVPGSVARRTFHASLMSEVAAPGQVVETRWDPQVPCHFVELQVRGERLARPLKRRRPAASRRARR